MSLFKCFRIIRSYLFAYWVILHAFMPSADFFSKLTFSKNSHKNTSAYQTVCKGFQQMTLSDKQASHRNSKTQFHGFSMIKNAFLHGNSLREAV